MEAKLKQLLVESYSRNNILHLTSVCPQQCIFCSHQFNPPGIETFSPGHLSLALIEDLLGFLDPERTVRTGESVNRVIEGEPLCHPDFFKILGSFRNQLPTTPLEIVTTGDLLNRDRIKELAGFRPLSLKISLNLIDPDLRKRFLGSAREYIEPVLDNLKNECLPFKITAVALPQLTGWEKLEETVLRASRYCPEDITLYRPGIAGKAHGKLPLSLVEDQKLEDHVSHLQGKMDIPVLLEPPRLTDFNPIVAGIKKGSPAARAGLKRGDIILQVDGMGIHSRVEAHIALNQNKGKKVMVKKQGKEMELILETEPGSSSGAIFYRDIHSRIIEEIKRMGQVQKVGIVTSIGAYPLLQAGLGKSEVRVFPFANRAFGGSIDSAGLLGIRDIVEQWDEVTGNESLEKVVLPAVMFDSRGRDLWGLSLSKLEEQLGLPCTEISS